MENEIPDNELPDNKLPDKKLPDNELPGNELPVNELPTPTSPDENADALQVSPTPPENVEEQAPIIQEEDDSQINKTIRRRTFLSFGVFAILYTLGIVGWRALRNQPKDDEVLKPLRKVLNGNEKVNTKFFSDHHLAAEYPQEQALADPRFNGDAGIDEDFDIDSWSLAVQRHPEGALSNESLELKMDEIKSLPKQEVVFDFKCIEGWSMITHWGGARFSDFLAHYKLGTRSGNAPDPAHPEDLYKYVGLKTPDEQYYVGIDMKSIMHPQTLLCYELNSDPLPVKHGYPLRLIIPVKYGVKNLKCVGTIFFSDTRPPDYWFERGYDYDCAL